MKRKFSIIFCVLLSLPFCLVATQTPAQQNSPFEDFLDSKREGLFAGGGIAYGSTRFSFTYSKGDRESVDLTSASLAPCNGDWGTLYLSVWHSMLHRLQPISNPR